MVTTRGGKTLEVEKQEARSCQTELKELGVRTRKEKERDDILPVECLYTC